MLLEFIRDNRSELIRRTREKVRSRASPPPTPEELESGVPLFLTQFTELLVVTDHDGKATPELNAGAAQHGNDLLRRGFTISQVVHDYGDICQAITELAIERKTEFTTPEFHILNLSLDNAIANAVTEYSRQREQNLAAEEDDRLGFLANELRSAISTATIGFEVVRSGSVAVGGSTGALVARSMKTLAEPRSRHQPQERRRELRRDPVEQARQGLRLHHRSADRCLGPMLLR
jgi:hypothetical protein